MGKEIAVLLHDIRSAHNVGSIFRTADAAGVSKIFLSGYTPRPKDRFGRVQKEIAKTALGAETFVAWKYHTSPHTVIARLHEEGWRIAAVEQDGRATDYRKFRLKKPTLFIFGNELRGIPRSVLEASDAVVEIPMKGKKESLNVSVAAGIILFSVREHVHDASLRV